MDWANSMLAEDVNNNLPDVSVSVSDFVDLVNETYEFAFPSIIINGELANLRVSKNKWLYFDLKDETASVKFFGTIYHLPGPLENGMLLSVRGAPHMHELYGFSVNVQSIQTSGEGSIRRAAELLTAKLRSEGLFDASRKRPLPFPPQRIGLITSGQSAAYADFIKILGARWCGVAIEHIDVQVQGEAAPSQIVNALQKFSAMAHPPEVLVLIRGGGSTDDLAAFSTEQVTRAVASSRIPTLVAIGHEIDTSLAELAADARASTPSNAAELLVPDKRVELENLSQLSERMYDAAMDSYHELRIGSARAAAEMYRSVVHRLSQSERQIQQTKQLFEVLNPEAILRRGYAVVRSKRGQIGQTADTMPQVGDTILVELLSHELVAIITALHAKNTIIRPKENNKGRNAKERP